MSPRTASILATLLVTLTLSGCGGYVMQGRVVADEFSLLEFVPRDDPRLDTGEGVQGAQILVSRDATRGNERVVARGTADSSGRFSIPLAEFGAGWMVERWRIEAHRTGFRTVDLILTLPEAKADEALLIVMSPGQSIRSSDDDPLSQLERFK